MSISPSFAIAITALAGAACLRAVLREGCGLPVKRWRLVIPSMMALVVAVAMVTNPMGGNAARPIVWLAALIIGLAFGAVAGCSLRLQVDHGWGLIRLPRARDGRHAAIAVAALAALDGLAAIYGLTGFLDRAMLSAGVVFYAGYLDGRASVLIARSVHAPHEDLLGPGAPVYI